MLNRIILMGRLTRDPELRRTGSGTAVTSFSLAVDRDFKSQSGEKETDFIDIVAWRNTAEFVSKYFTKGRMAVVEGRLQIRDWTDKDGGKRRSAEVVAVKLVPPVPHAATSAVRSASSAPRSASALIIRTPPSCVVSFLSVPRSCPVGPPAPAPCISVS